MRRLLIAFAFAASAVLAAEPALAQVRVQNNYATMPKPRKNPPVILPKVIPPSVALNRAMAHAPNSKALGVKLKGSLYIVKLKQGNKVTQVRVDAATGAVSP